MRKLFFMMILLFGLSTTYSQADQVSIHMGLYNSNIKIFFINDFDLTQTGNSPPLFWVDLVNSGDTIRISIQLSITYNSLSSGETELASGETAPFILPPGLTRINNQNLFSDQDTYGLHNYVVNDDAADDLLDVIYGTGRLPRGIYAFKITSASHDSIGSVNNEILEVEVGDLTTLDLIAPGNEADETDLMEIYTVLPFFRWESDGTEFRIRVCEKLSTNSSPEDVMNNEPRLETTLESTFFQYPATEAFPLTEGHNYYWQITAITPSSSGPVELESEIWGFKVADFSQGSTALTQQQILNYLRLLLGDDAIDELFNESGEMNGFHSTGTILQNSNQINTQDLNQFIEQFMTGNVKINGFAIE
ncbi:hypothetical protein JW960_03820 [candidate division KSB1 bacterium]|nr:hypothetical protein [candidate division KSB1 bacterium]